MIKRALSLALALLATGCADDGPVYAGTEFGVQSAPPSPASFEPDRIKMVAGEAVKVVAIPHSSSDLEYMDEDLLILRSGDPQLLDVFSTENNREFVLVANQAGQTCLEVTINRHREECISVQVLAPITE